MSRVDSRTVLLARPGEARDRLRAALEQSGVELVLQADPLEAGVDDVAAADARNLVIAVDAEVEDALDRFDALLADDRYRILFEETAVVNARDGWDVARWSRHLAAKLLGHGDVLPEGHEPDGVDDADLGSMPVASQADAPTAETEADEGAADEGAGDSSIAGDGLAAGDTTADPHNDTVPAEQIETAQPPDASAITAQPAVEHVEFEYDDDAATFGAALPEAAAVASSSDVSAGTPADADADGDWMRFQDFEATNDLPAANAPKSVESEYRAAFAPMEAAELPHDQVYERIGEEFERFGSDAAVPADRWQDYDRPVAEAPPVPAKGTDEPAEPVQAPMAPSEWDLSDEPLSQASQPAASDAQDYRLTALESRISSLSLVDHGDDAASLPQAPSAGEALANDTPGQAAQRVEGAVLLLGGIGGPDSLRQVLQNLSPTIGVPVLVQQWLDGGHYDRLVRQMDRASQMPVQLAEAGKPMAPGHAYIVPVSVGVERDPQGAMRFVDAPARGFADVLSALPAAASGVVLLSGTSEDFVEPVLRFQQAGGRVFAQTEEGCYDHAVPALLISRGAEAQLPTGIATQIAARWQQQAQA